MKGDIRQIKSSFFLLDDQRKAFESGYVGQHCNGLAALASYRFHGFVQPLLPPRDHHNPAAVAAQLLRNSTAHSIRTARNHGSLAGDAPLHFFPPCCCNFPAASTYSLEFLLSPLRTRRRVPSLSRPPHPP